MALERQCYRSGKRLAVRNECGWMANRWLREHSYTVEQFWTNRNNALHPANRAWLLGDGNNDHSTFSCGLQCCVCRWICSTDLSADELRHRGRERVSGGRNRRLRGRCWRSRPMESIFEQLRVGIGSCL